MPLRDLEARRAYDRERKRVEYANLSNTEYSRLLLRKRRNKALARRKRRSEEGT